MRSGPCIDVLALMLICSLGGCRQDPSLPGEMVLVPAGPFVMGIKPRAGSPRRKNRQKVHLDAFRLDRTEVTVAQYARFIRQTGYKAPFVAEPWAAPYNWAGGEPPPGVGDHPVTLVNWFDARAYCRWAGKQLPTEAQWEKAALGTDGRRFPWGDTWDGSACNHGKSGADNYDASDGHETTAPVGSYPGGRSPYGLEDMFGNAWEWTADWFSDSWQSVPASRKDGVPVNPVGPATGYQRMVRGGSYFFDLEHHWAAEPMFMFPGNRRKTTGFRCARGQ